MARGNLVPSGNRPGQALGRRRNFDPATSLQRDIDRAFDDFWRTLNFPLPQLMTGPLADVDIPRVNMRDRGDSVEVSVEIPGADQEDVDVSIGDGELTVSAEATEEHDTGDDRYTMREMGVARVERTIPIPEGLDIDRATAALRNGILTITIPKSQGAQSSQKRINVESGRQ